MKRLLSRWMERPRSLRAVLMAAMSAGILLQALLAMAGVHFLLAPTLERSAQTGMRETADAIGRRVAGLMLRAEGAARGAAELLALLPGREPRSLESVLALPVRESPLVIASYWVDAQGIVRAAVRAAAGGSPVADASHIGLDVSRSRILTRAQAGHAGFTEPFLSPVSEGLMVGIAHPTRSDGWLVVEIGLPELSRDLASQLARGGFTAMLYDERGRILAQPDLARSQQSGQLDRPTVGALGAGRVSMADVELDGKVWRVHVGDVDAQGMGWSLAVMRPLTDVQAPIRLLLLSVVLFALLLLLAGFSLAAGLASRLTAQVTRVARQAEALAAGVPVEPAQASSVQEIEALQQGLAQLAAAVREREDRLRQLNAGLEQQVQERTEHLARSRDALEQALATLSQAQAELVHKEKLAALGALVASVAHEMNTPIGNALMASTSLLDRARELVAMVQGGKISRSHFNDSLLAITDAAELAERSLNRAAQLVSSFKQVAADQTSEVHRSFELATLCREIVTVLTPSLRRSGASVVLNIEEGLMLSSYPGPLGQVLSNLIENAVVHGLGNQAGEVRVQAHREGLGQVRIEVQDDGEGMSPEVIQRIYEPFFTTRRGRGGTGLGLTITHNLVTGLLQGQLDVTSHPGGGTVFGVVLPTDLPSPSRPMPG
ncbi:MAG: hypothetical protein J0L58_12250 [Burkholderiales bacterium]|nr:hypothetical protein [Burkholderiales bacterium]